MASTITTSDNKAAVGHKKHRSPNYTAIGLGQAIPLVRALYEKARRTPVPESAACTAMGYRGLNGTTRGHLSALRKFGLIEDQGKNVRVSELALRIIVNAEGSEEQRASIREAAFKPEIIRELYETHREVSDEVLRPHLLLTRGFSEAGADQFIQAFRDTLALVARNDSGYNGGMSNPNIQTPPPPSTGAGLPAGGGGRLQVRSFSWPLDDDTTAEVRITGTQVSRDHLDALIEYLEVAKKRLSERKRHDA